LPDLHSFTRGLKRDYDAVLNGLTLPWSSGAVEGNVNRLKMIKRQNACGKPNCPCHADPPRCTAAPDSPCSANASLLC
jgi:transposase